MTTFVSVFIDPSDQIGTRLTTHGDGTISVSVSIGLGGISIFGSPAKLLDFGQAIVKACETVAYGQPDPEDVTHDFRPPADPFMPPTEPPCDIVDYAIASAERTPNVPNDGAMMMAEAMAPEDENPF